MAMNKTLVMDNKEEMRNGDHPPKGPGQRRRWAAFKGSPGVRVNGAVVRRVPASGVFVIPVSKD